MLIQNQIFSKLKSRCFRPKTRSGQGRKGFGGYLWPKLCLAYLDPYNLQYLSISVIEKLARLSFVDFAVLFSTMDLRRNVLMEYNPERARFDAAAPGWRDHIDPLAFVRGDADEAFFDYWCGLVRGLGFSISHRMPLVRDDGNRPLYHLVFFSRHELPNRIWGDVAQGPNREFDF